MESGMLYPLFHEILGTVRVEKDEYRRRKFKGIIDRHLGDKETSESIPYTTFQLCMCKPWSMCDHDITVSLIRSKFFFT